MILARDCHTMASISLFESDCCSIRLPCILSGEYVKKFFWLKGVVAKCRENFVDFFIE